MKKNLLHRSLSVTAISGNGGSNVGPIDINNYLTIEALEDGLTASLSENACEYCVDGDGDWKTIAASATTESINAGQTVSFRGNLTPLTNKGVGTFTINKKCNLKGNCMSMLFGDDVINNTSLSGKDYSFYKLFYNCANIITVSSDFLPAITLDAYCYHRMFYGCTSLTSVPELPATTLKSDCYSYMFYGCTSLTKAPELPATTLAEQCYLSMFYRCTSLITAPALPATTLTNTCYKSMFSSCTSLTTAPELPATTLTEQCYCEMFRECESLVTVPNLPATTLTKQCYDHMFYNCTKLNYIKMLATDISATDCLYYWVYHVSSTGLFVKNANMTSLPTATSSSEYTGIPSGWTVQNAVS